MLKFILIMFCGLFVTCHDDAKAEPFDCKTHKLFCEIIKFNPHMDRAEAMNLSNKIYSKAKLNGIEPKLALAILMHESGLKNVNTFKSTISVAESCSNTDCVKTTTQVDKVFDMSIAQINIGTARDYGFDVERLYKGDIDYALDCFMLILKEKENLCRSLNKEPTWSCYHSINDEYRLIYIDLVSRHL